MRPKNHPIYGDATPEDVARSLLKPIPENATSDPEYHQPSRPSKGDADEAA